MREYRLGFDIDEVVSKLSPKLLEFLKEEFGIEHSIEVFKTYGLEENKYVDDPELNTKISNRMLEVANDPYFQNKTEPVKDAPKIIHKWKHLGHKIFFISARRIGCEEHTINWLKSFGIPFDGVYHLGHRLSKGVVCDELELDFFAEDRVKYLIQLFELKNRWDKGLVLFNRPWNVNRDISNYPIKRIDTWTELDMHLHTYGENF